MSLESRSLTVSYLVEDPEHLPLKDGREMTADEVDAEITEVINAALADWYAKRGHQLVAFEPTV